MRLKHEGDEFAICSYTKGSGISEEVLPYSSTYADSTPESFKRRAYWLKDDPKHVLVHYLDESNKYYLPLATAALSLSEKLQNDNSLYNARISNSSLKDTARSENGSLTIFTD